MRATIGTLLMATWRFNPALVVQFNLAWLKYEEIDRLMPELPIRILGVPGE